MSFSYLRAFRYTVDVLRGYQVQPSDWFESRGEPAPIFLPPAGKKPRATILLTHGMAALGNQDPRIFVVSSSLAKAGYRVLVPHFPEIKDLVVDPISIDHITSDIVNIAKDSDTNPSGKIGIISASFSASLSTVAACRKDANDYISAIFCIGPFGNVHRVLEFMFSDSKSDPYGFFIVMKNFLFSEEHPLRLAFDHAAKDNGLKRIPPLLGDYLNSLDIALQEEFQRALKDSHYRQERWKELSVQPRATGMMKEVNAIDYLENLKAPLLLLHGKGDDVIPAIESTRLYNRCLELGKKSHIVITELISHGTPQIGLHLPVQIHKTVSIVAQFFRYIENAWKMD